LVRLAANQPPAALRLSGPLLVVQVEIGPLPKDASLHTALFRKLLELNASDLVYAAYALNADNDNIVLLAAHELVSLDANELETTLADFDLALANHVGMLHGLTGAQ
jgi:hypothetical protein